MAAHAGGAILTTRGRTRGRAALELDRRELLRALTVLAGGALSPGCASFVLEERSAGAARGATRRVLDPGERETLAIAAEAILPATDTPGARDAGVPEFIEWMLADWLEEEEAREFRAGLAGLDDLAAARSGTGFASSDDAVRHAVLTELDLASREQSAPGGPSLLPSQGRGPARAPRDFFVALRELVLVGYYTSEIGATQELRRFVAGGYEPCVPYARLGRAWSE